MSLVECLSEVSVAPTKPSAVTTGKGFRPPQLDMVSSVRAHLEATGGVVVLECGCFMRVHPDALKTLPEQDIVDALCDTMGCCAHQQVQH